MRRFLKAGFCLKCLCQGADIVIILLDDRCEFVTLGDAHAQTFDGNINDLVAVIKDPHPPDNVDWWAIRTDKLRFYKGILVLLDLIADDKLLAVKFLELVGIIQGQIVLQKNRKLFDLVFGN